MRDKSFANRIKFDLTETKEKEALRKIYGLDKKFQNKTFQNVQKHDDLIVHIRENKYGDRKVVQAQFRLQNEKSWFLLELQLWSKQYLFNYSQPVYKSF